MSEWITWEFQIWYHLTMVGASQDKLPKGESGSCDISPSGISCCAD